MPWGRQMEGRRPQWQGFPGGRARVPTREISRGKKAGFGGEEDVRGARGPDRTVPVAKQSPSREGIKGNHPHRHFSQKQQVGKGREK